MPSGKSFFRRLHAERDRCALLGQRNAARITVQNIFGVDILRDIGGLGPGRNHPGFLVAREDQHKIARWLPAFCLEAQEGGCQIGNAIFVVGGSAAKEKALFLDQRERRPDPVLGQRVDHIHMAEQNDRLGGAARFGAIGDHQSLGFLALAIIVGDLDIIIAESGCFEPVHQIGDHRRHLLLPARGAKGDDIAVDVAGQLLVRGEHSAILRKGGLGGEPGSQRSKSDPARPFAPNLRNRLHHHRQIPPKNSILSDG